MNLFSFVRLSILGDHTCIFPTVFPNKYITKLSPYIFYKVLKFRLKSYRREYCQRIIMPTHTHNSAAKDELF